MPINKGARKGAGVKRGTVGAPLKNHRSQSDISDIFEAIRRTLAEGGARRIAFDYDEAGQASEITFALPIGEHLAAFRLPARLDAVAPVLIESYRAAGRSIPRGEALKEQVYKTGWANIRDWLAGQIALIRTRMVKPQEVFLPYLLNEAGQTYFEAFEQRLALSSPQAGVKITEGESDGR